MIGIGSRFNLRARAWAIPALALLLVAVANPPAARAEIVYDNTLFDTFLTVPYSLGIDEIGDQVTMTRPGTITDFQVELFNFADDSGTADFTLFIHAVGPGNTVGTLLGSASVTGVAIPSVSDGGFFDVLLTGLSIVVPQEIIWLLALDAVSNLDLEFGPNLYDPPTIGSSDPEFAWLRIGPNYFDFSLGADPANFNARITMEPLAPPPPGSGVPEPATTLLAGVVLAGAALAARRQTRRRQQPA